MKEILLTKGHVAQVDDDFYEVLNFHKWYSDTSKHSKTNYACRSISFEEKRQIKVKMHHFVMTLAGVILQNEIDHKDGNGLNNQLSNLRIATPFQNKQNRKIRADNKSGYKGVWYNQRLRKWGAQIQSNGIKHHLGWYENPKLAALAYNGAAKEFHGSFAYLNHIE